VRARKPGRVPQRERVNSPQRQRKASQTARGFGAGSSRDSHVHRLGRYSGTASPRRRPSCGCCSEFIRPCRGCGAKPATTRCRGLHDVAGEPAAGKAGSPANCAGAMWPRVAVRGSRLRAAAAGASELAATTAESLANCARLRGGGSSRDSHVHRLGRYSGTASPRTRPSCGCCSEFIRPCRGCGAKPATTRCRGLHDGRVNPRLEKREAPQTARGYVAESGGARKPD
jgi:hypothetical protein